MSKSKPPPGPGLWQKLTLSRQFRHDALGLLRNWQRQYGDIVYVGMGPLRFYWVFHPDLAREVLVTRAKEFRLVSNDVLLAKITEICYPCCCKLPMMKVMAKA